MWNRACQREADVRQMVRRGDDDPALREHAAGCAACRETLAVGAWMRELAALPAAEGPMADASHLWWKAELLRRWDANRRATSPLDRGEPVQVGIGVLGAVLVLLWLWREAPNLSGVLSRVDTWTLSGLNAPIATAVAVSLACLVVIAVATTRDLFVRD